MKTNTIIVQPGDVLTSQKGFVVKAGKKIYSVNKIKYLGGTEWEVQGDKIEAEVLQEED